MLKDMERRLYLIEEKQKELSPDLFTISAYCSIKGVNVSLSDVGDYEKDCSIMSKELDYPIMVNEDRGYGQVNSYHIDVLTEIIGCE